MVLGQDNHDVERKPLAILRVLNSSKEPLGGHVIVDRLGLQGATCVGGLNPVASAIESGIDMTPHAMSGVIDTSRLVSSRQLEVDSKCIEC